MPSPRPRAARSECRASGAHTAGLLLECSLPAARAGSGQGCGGTPSAAQRSDILAGRPMRSDSEAQQGSIPHKSSAKGCAAG
eukprot:2891268-Rhodomonas_salina.1